MSALGSLFFGRLINATSASNALLFSAIGIGLLALGVFTLPFMRRLDEKPETADSKTKMEGGKFTQKFDPEAICT